MNVQPSAARFAALPDTASSSGAQAAAPAAEKEPGAHGAQAVAFVAPAAAEAVPAGHGDGAAEPSGQKAPAGHTTGAPDPQLKPGAQGAQVRRRRRLLTLSPTATTPATVTARPYAPEKEAAVPYPSA